MSSSVFSYFSLFVCWVASVVCCCVLFLVVCVFFYNYFHSTLFLSVIVSLQFVWWSFISFYIFFYLFLLFCSIMFYFCTCLLFFHFVVVRFISYISFRLVLFPPSSFLMCACFFNCMCVFLNMFMFCSCYFNFNLYVVSLFCFGCCCCFFCACVRF